MIRFACLVFLVGCSSITDFDVDEPVPEQEVPGSALPGPLATLFPIPLNLDLSAQIQKQHTGPIDSVTLSNLSLDITDTDRAAGDTDDWSFVTHIDVFVESTQSGTTLPKTKIATVDSPGAVQKLVFDVDGGVNLKPYIDEGAQVDSSGMGTAPADNVSYDGDSTFTVHPI